LATRTGSRHSALGSPDDRFHREEAPDSRTPAQRDRDRILYSGAFARLAEITQVVSPERGYVFHNRLTHSLKVAQIARRIAEYLNRDQPTQVRAIGGIDPDAAEAAGLAHDLGHPPFGHIAEEELDALVRDAGVRDGYEGNAQSFRIVARLAVSDACDPNDSPIGGLNLTRRTLDGILKYPWAHGNRRNPKKWGYYSTEAEVFEWVRDGRRREQRSVIAEIMDWSDDITFAIHDLVDFYCAGRIPIDRCKGNKSDERDRLTRGMFGRKPQWLVERSKYEEALAAIIDNFPFEPDERYTDCESDRARLYAFSTALIKYFVGALHLNTSVDALSLVCIEPDARMEVEVLKQFIWEYIIENPDLAVPQNGQRVAIQTVFRDLLEASSKGKFFLFPPVHQDVISKARRASARVRVVADCISGMTEKEIMHFYRCLQGHS
jgi:dGTPase